MQVEQEGQKNYLTVTALTKYLARKFDVDPYLKDVILIGELSNFNPKATRHRYFSLKDDQSKLNAVMFKSDFDRLTFQPEEGMRVIVQGRVSIYGPSGRYQITIKSMQPDGVGALYQAFEQLKNKLKEQGVFDRPRLTVPRFPKNIAVITSPSGAVIRDILTTVQRRYPIVGVTVFPTRVQGQEAKYEIVRALQRVEELKDQFDVIILARGGGSIEDLWSFNEEMVAQAMLQSSLPIISSIGHETDVTIADYVADLRAATPTAAAELAVPVLSEVLSLLKTYDHRLQSVFYKQIQMLKKRLEYSQQSYIFQDPVRIYQTYAQRLDELTLQLNKQSQQMIRNQGQRLEYLHQRLKSQNLSQMINQTRLRLVELDKQVHKQINQQLQNEQNALMTHIQLLDALSPLKIMQRGYAIVEQDEMIVRSVNDVNPDHPLSIQLYDGMIVSTVDQMISKENRNDGR